MFDAFTHFPQLGADFLSLLTVTSLCSLRMFVMLAIFPPTADGALQGLVRNAVVLIMSVFVAAGQPADLATTVHGAALIIIGLKEAFIGLLLGWSASLVFWVAESVGTYIDDVTGYNNVQITNPMSNAQSTPTATLMQQLATVAFWSFGGILFLLGAVYDSFRWWPLTNYAPVPARLLEGFVIAQTDTLMQMVAKLAAPFLLVLMLVDFGFGIVAKSAQKLDLMSQSQPIKGAVTVLMLALFAGLFIDQVKPLLSLADLARLLRSAIGGPDL